MPGRCPAAMHDICWVIFNLPIHPMHTGAMLLWNDAHVLHRSCYAVSITHVHGRSYAVHVSYGDRCTLQCHCACTAVLIDNRRSCIIALWYSIYVRTMRMRCHACGSHVNCAHVYICESHTLAIDWWCRRLLMHNEACRCFEYTSHVSHDSVRTQSY